MGVEERYQKRLKEGGASASPSAYNGVEARWKANNVDKIRQEVNNRVTTWLTNYQVYVDNYNSRYQGKNNKYRNDASDWLSTITTQKSNFDKEADSIRNLLNEYKDYFVKDDWAGKVLIALDSGSRQQSKILEASTKDLEYWSNWESEDKYNEAIKALEADEAMKKYDLNSAKVELDDLNSQLKNAESMNLQISQLRGKINQDENKLRSYGRYDLNAQKLEQEIAKNRETLKTLESQYKAIDTDALKNTISEKSSYYTLASRKQEAVKLASVVNNPDFEEYAMKGTSIKNPSYTELHDQWVSVFGIGNTSKLEKQVGNKVTFARESQLDAATTGITGGGLPVQLPFYNNLYNQMTDEEVKIYSYYLAKGDTKSADRYLETLTETLNQRQAGESFEAIEGNTGMELIFGVVAGLDQFASGVKNLGNAIKGEEDYIAPSVGQIMSGMVREDLEDNGFKIFGNSLGQIGYDAINTTANMLPSMLVSQIPVVGQVAGAALLGASSAGNAYAEMINLGYDKGQARSYATLVGASEAGLQYLLGGISSLGGAAKGGLTKLALSKVDNAFGRVAIQLGGSMLSEGMEESLQTILEPWFKSITTGADFEAPDIDEVLYSGLLGALTAGVLEGGGTVSEAIGTHKVGKQLKGTEGSVQRLVNLGQTLSADTAAYQLAGKVNENTGAYTIGRLFNEVGAEVTAQNQADIQKSLIRKGVAESDAVKISQAFADIVSGVELTKEQAAIVEANTVISKTIVDVIINPNSTVNQRRLGYSQILMDLAGEKVGTTTNASAQPQTATETAETSQVDNSSSKIESAEIGRYTASEDGKTHLKDTGEEIEISDVATIKDGELILKTKDGGTVEADNVTFKDKDTALLYESLVDMGVNAAEANLLIHNYDLSKVEDGNALSLDDYTKGIAEAYQYGKSGILFEDISSRGFAALLDEKQRRDAHTLGHEKVWNKTLEKQQEVDKKRADVAVKAKEEGKEVSKKKGNVYLNGDVVSESSMKSELQKASVEGMKIISEALGNDIHLFESYKNEEGKLVYKDKNGVEKLAPNGWIESDGSIWIDINAGNDGKGTMLFTLSHELTHFIKDFSPAKYQVYVDFLAQTYSENGKDFSSEIAKKQKRAKDNGREISYDEAFDEVIADASSIMLLDSNAIAELAKQDKTLWEKIKSFIKDIVDRIKKAYENLDPDAREAKAIREINGAVEELSALWLDALKDAGEAYSTIAGTTEADVRYSLRGTNANGIEVYETSEEIKKLSAKEKIKAFYDIMVNQYRGRTAKFVRNGHAYYAVFDEADVNKNIYGDKRSDKKGLKAKINVGADGDIFELVENSQYNGSARESGKNIVAHKGVNYWDYFIKTVQIDNKVFDLVANVRKKSDSSYVYSIQLNENKKIAASPPLGSAERALNRVLNATNNSLSQNSENSQQKFSLRENVEETKDLVAVHNLNEEKLLKSLQLGGLPMPSVAIIRAREGHDKFGNISLVFGKETIDPQFFRSNKVYSGDAWTPTYPRVDYKINDKAQEKIRNKINKLVPSEVQTALGRAYLDSDNLTATMDRHGGNMVTAYKTNYTMKYAYLLDKGNNIELPMTEKELSHFGKHSNKEIIKVAESVSKEDLLKALNGSVDEAYTVEPAIRQAVSEALKEKYPDNPPWLEMLLPKEELPFSELNSYAQEALDYLSKGLQQTVDYKAAKPMIDERVDQGEYEKWIKELFSDIVAKEGIRNNKDIFTPSGNRRSFEALHYEHNLENVIKAMKEEGSKGIGFGGGSIFGASTTEFSSVEDIKNSAETRLQSLSNEEFEEIKKGFTDRFFELASSLPKHKDSFTATDDAANMLVEAVVKYKTKSGIASYIRRESQGWANYSDYVVDDLIELVKDIQQMPTRYFEAKPERAVGFDEVKAVIIPDNSSAELKTALKEKNFNVLEYPSGNKEERTAMLNSIENVRFSERDSDGNELSREQQEYFKDSKVRDENGNLLVMYHGTPNAGFTKFKSGTYFTQYKWYADRYQSQSASSLGVKKTANSPDTYAVYLNIQKPFDTRNKAERDIFYNEYYRQWGTGTDLMESGLPDWLDGMDLQEFLEEMGYDYDGLILDEGGVGGYGEEVVSRGLSYVTFSSEQVKNIDNKAPTSDPDIRFSERDYEQLEQERKVRRVLEKENEKLKEDNQYLKALVKLQKEVTHGTKMTQTSVDKAAKMLMNDINAKGNRAELVELLNNFYSYIAKGENLAWDSIAVEAKPIVDWLQNHQVTKVEPDPYAQQILSNIRSRRIYLDEQQKAEVASAYGSYNNFRKKTMGRMIIANDSSLSLDSHWQELSSLYPEYFDLETTTNDMPIKLMEIIDVLQDSGSRNMEYEYYEEMRAQDLLMQVYDSYWKVSTLYTVADVKQQEINKLKIKHSQKMQALKEEHKTQDAQLKKDYQERLNKMRLEYRERNAKTQREIMNRYQESRKKAVENRGKTELRHKIRRVVNELNQLLLKGTKDKHVMDDLQKVVAEALEAVNMDTVGAEQRLNGYTDENGVYHKGYNQRIAESSDPDTIKELTATRDRIQLQGDSIKERLKALRDAYEQIQTSDDPEIKNSYHDVILDKIKEVVDLVGDTPLRFMNSNQLESVYDMYKMILTAVRTSNKAFKAAKGETITQLAENVNSEVYRVGGEKERRLKVMSYINKFGWEALKPIYAFRTIGSNTLTRIYNNLRKGEDVFYKDAVEGSDFIKSQYEKHGYKDWDVKATKTFKAKSGKSFDLTLEQMMSIYAYSRREQAHDHLIKGGIVFEDAVVEEKKLGLPVKYEVNTKSAFNLSEETLVEIISSLTDKQKAFVEEMQEYLSTTMGAKGNEVSLEMFGVKLFKEKYYFPLKSSQYYMNFKPEEAGEIKLKSPSFSKATVEHANNPVVLSNFTDVWANHVNDMAMYHSFTLPLEDFARVFNYKTKTDANVETISTEATLASAYGNGVTEYIRTFLRDLNGGVRVPSTPMDAWVSRAKKGAVMASASVVIQQGSAVMRAMAYVDAKHFVATVGKSLNLFNHKKDWTELKTYAPIAGIKEMGYFDVGMGKSTVSWIKSNDTVMDKIDNALSKAPALADEIAWVQIWQAVKRETMHNNPSLSPRSEEFLKLAGERFTEVVSLTQVYDSVFSRSGMMRNKNGLMKMATAFMAEPTVQLNMLVDMGIQGKRMGGMQGVKFGARVTGSVLSSIVVNAMLKSLITAARDDDEDETYAEKYAEAFTGDMVGNLNPLNLIPVVKDIVSIFNGYDVSRMDMNLFSDLKKAIDDFDKDNKSQAEKWADLAGAISAFFGVPVKNVKRDIMAAINLVSTLTSDNETTKESLMDAIAEGATGKDKSVSTKLYEAIVSGDEEYRARLEKQLEGKNISTYIRQGLRENDPRIKEAAEAHNRGDVDERVRIAKDIIAEGNFKQDDVVAAINSEAIALKNKNKSEPEATETPKEEVEKTTSLYSANDAITAFESGDTALAKEIIDDLIAVKMANGAKEKEAKSSLRSSMTSKLKPLYLTADDNARMEIRYFMRDTGLYGGTSDVINTCRNWLKDE